ncbi:MAG: class F sortase [Anaerolineae bacterium]|nr:class F sortase [Anaerolineae bacterium]MDW8172056.1 class F sortase [Anaerolineae bacterium]
MLNHVRHAVLLVFLILGSQDFIVTAQANSSRLIIPSIELDAPIRTSPAPFVRRLRTWDFSKIKDEVALLQWMPRFGEPGNSILAGHHRDREGQPSTLYRLSEVQVGDLILIQAGEQLLIYTVTEAFSTDDRDLSILRSSEDEKLTLFTCHGDYDLESKMYRQRFVVVAQRSG